MRGALLRFVWDPADGVLSCAAVPRVGLWPTAPPLCRYAEYTADLILESGRVFNRYGRVLPGVASAVRNRPDPADVAGFSPQEHTLPYRQSGFCTVARPPRSPPMRWASNPCAVNNCNHFRYQSNSCLRNILNGYSPIYLKTARGPAKTATAHSPARPWARGLLGCVSWPLRPGPRARRHWRCVLARCL